MSMKLLIKVLKLGHNCPRHTLQNGVKLSIMKENSPLGLKKNDALNKISKVKLKKETSG